MKLDIVQSPILRFWVLFCCALLSLLEVGVDWRWFGLHRVDLPQRQPKKSTKWIGFSCKG